VGKNTRQRKARWRKRSLAPQPRKLAAYHEAGRFVAHYFHAGHAQANRVTIAASVEAARQHRCEDPLWQEPSVREIQRLIIGIYAGFAAEVRFDPSCEKDVSTRRAASRDEEKAQAYLLVAHGRTKERAECEIRLRAQARLVVVEHWDAVTALALELLEKTTLDGYEAAWIVAIAEGERAKRDLADHRRSMAARADDAQGEDAGSR
jgi:hypothetical protein